MAINKVILIGKLARDIEVKEIKPGLTLGKFSLHLEDLFIKRDGTSYTENLFVECVLWNQIAETHNDLVKDEMVCVEGRLKSEKWTDKTGQERWKLVVQVSKAERIRKPQPDPEGFVREIARGPLKTPSDFDREHQSMVDTDLPF